MDQTQFLNLKSAEDAYEIFWNAIKPKPNSEEQITLDESRGRILSRNIFAPLNIPFYDRSNFDGFAVKSKDTFGAEENKPIKLSLNKEILKCGVEPKLNLAEGTSTYISTGGVIPRGSDGVVLIENTVIKKDVRCCFSNQ